MSKGYKCMCSYKNKDCNYHEYFPLVMNMCVHILSDKYICFSFSESLYHIIDLSAILSLYLSIVNFSI